MGYAASVYHEQAYYIFGGRGSTDSYLTKIGRLDAVKRTWSLAGSLKQGRRGHGVIFDGEQFVVIGGYTGSLKTENCIISGETITCTQIGPGLDDYAYYPELALVDDNYGNDC